MSIRDEIRAKILSQENMRGKSVELKFFGADIELRQPSLGQIQQYMESGDNKISLIRMLLDYAYVPGTDERVFEAGDVEALSQLPFGEDMSKVAAAIEKFTSLVIGDAEKN